MSGDITVLYCACARTCSVSVARVQTSRGVLTANHVADPNSRRQTYPTTQFAREMDSVGRADARGRPACLPCVLEVTGRRRFSVDRFWRPTTRRDDVRLRRLMFGSRSAPDHQSSLVTASRIVQSCEWRAHSPCERTNETKDRRFGRITEHSVHRGVASARTVRCPMDNAERQKSSSCRRWTSCWSRMWLSGVVVVVVACMTPTHLADQDALHLEAGSPLSASTGRCLQRFVTSHDMPVALSVRPSVWLSLILSIAMLGWFVPAMRMCRLRRLMVG